MQREREGGRGTKTNIGLEVCEYKLHRPKSLYLVCSFESVRKTARETQTDRDTEKEKARERGRQTDRDKEAGRCVKIRRTDPSHSATSIDQLERAR